MSGLGYLCLNTFTVLWDATPRVRLSQHAWYWELSADRPVQLKLVVCVPVDQPVDRYCTGFEFISIAWTNPPNFLFSSKPRRGKSIFSIKIRPNSTVCPTGIANMRNQRILLFGLRKNEGLQYQRVPQRGR